VQETTGGRQSRRRGLSGLYSLYGLYSDVGLRRRLVDGGAVDDVGVDFIVREAYGGA